MPVRAADLETRLYATDREYNRTLADGERRAERFASNVSRSFGRAGGGISARGGLIPGLAQISEIIQGIPQVGRLAGALLDPLKDATQEGIRFNMMVESAEVGFVGVAKGIENARKHVAALRQEGEDNPLFDSSGLIRTSRLMNVFGFELSEHIPKIKIWGDAIASSGEMSEETLLGVARAFGQIKSLGRVNAEEMNQLAERGIPAWELLAKAIGKTVAETRKLGEQGSLRGGPAVEAITAQIAQDPRFKGTADRLAGTLQGRLARVGEIRERATGIATEGLTQDISTALSAALSREDFAVSMAGGIKTAIAPVSGLIRGAIVTTVGGGISGGFEEAVNAAKSVLPAQMMSLGTDGIINPLKAVLGIQSPSKVTFEMGLNLAEGLRNGFTAGMRLGFFQVGTGGGIRERLEAAADNPVVRAFFEAIRQAEGGAPNRIVGGGTFSDMSRHPNRVGFRGPAGPSTAAGSYQITGTNWRRIAPILGLTDFAARNQLLAALYLFNEEGGLDKLLAGDVEGAIRAAGRDWAAVPGSPLPGRSVSTATFTSNFQQALGGAGLSSMSVEQQQALIFRMAQSMGIWPKPSPGGDLAGGTGVFASGGMVDFPFAKTPGFTLNATKAVSTLSSGLRDAKEIQFDLLKAMGETGPVAEQGFGQAKAAVEDWYAKVVDSGNKAKTVFGITAQDAAGAFQDAWVGAFTQTDLNFKSMASSFVLTFTQSLNQMVQQWAAAQISAGLGKFLSWGIGALFGGGGLPQGSLTGSWAGDLLTPNTPRFATGGSFVVGGPGGTDKTPVSFLATKGEQVTVETPAQARARGATVINNHVTNIIYSPRVTPSSYTSRRSSREGFEMLLGMAR